MDLAFNIVPDSDRGMLSEHETSNEKSLQDSPSDRESAAEALHMSLSAELGTGDTQTGKGESHVNDFDKNLITKKD